MLYTANIISGVYKHHVVARTLSVNKTAEMALCNKDLSVLLLEAIPVLAVVVVILLKC